MGSVTYDLVVRGGRLADSGDVRDIAVRDGVIDDLLPARSGAVGREEIDASGRYVLPGLIDSHVHFRTPGLTQKEEWAFASRAAVAGGITTVIDMPNTKPATFTPADARDKDAAVRGTSLVDYRFHAGVDPDQVDRLLDFSPAEATSAKAFLTGHHTAPHVLRDPARLDRLFQIAKEKRLRLLFHAEDDDVFALLDQWQGSPPEYRDYERFRPRTGGIVAVAKLIALVRRHGTAIHVLHVSSREEADLLTAAGAAGLPVTWEVTGHHLSFTTDDTRRYGSRIRLSPAIREQADQDRLWEAVINGEVSTVGSDHAPHPFGDKVQPPPDAPPGLPGVQELLPGLFTGLRRRLPTASDTSLLRIVTRLLASEPARLFGLDHRKGRIAPGLDADLVLFDPAVNWSLTDVQAKCGWSAYAGWLFTGRVERTVRRGETVYAGDGTFGSPRGEWLTPALVRGGA
ncbi:dihydroorotase [Amycolatopsis xylanica]|uniref:Dihydroorotase n=1 Tax=Amycolatopsis xylanica TaxID=589385 RepID=A0A1H2UVS5_9PSEU|nr:dihydroorotase family protein [Amycolatopsis xylanica]SDW60186.1 dihydroorotase [Amycolatopsis xylanica]